MRRELLARVVSGEALDREQALAVGRDLVTGQSEPMMVAAFLGAIASRGEQPQELAGLAQAFRESVAPFAQHPEAVDTCGTGGDGQKTINLSTAAALTAACLGVPVAKHGNRSVSSACGSADVLTAMQFPVHEDAAASDARMRRWRFAFLFAPQYHPAMAHVAPVRKAMGVRTVFNLLGPLLNPAGVKRQVVGVYAPSRLGLMAEGLAALGVDHAMIVHGEGGYDEVVLHGSTQVAEVRGGAIEHYEVKPSDFGLREGDPGDIRGGTAEQNADGLFRVLDGRGSPGLRAAVAANTALALRVAGVDENLKDGAARALDALGTGEAGRYVRRMIESSAEVAIGPVP